MYLIFFAYMDITYDVCMRACACIWHHSRLETENISRLADDTTRTRSAAYNDMGWRKNRIYRVIRQYIPLHMSKYIYNNSRREL